MILHMNATITRMTLTAAALASAALAQQKGPVMPPPLGCGVHGDAEVICGTRSPEDLELTPDGEVLGCAAVRDRWSGRCGRTSRGCRIIPVRSREEDVREIDSDE